VLVDRKVANVSTDWTPPAPSTSPEILVHGKTLAEVAAALNKRDEWGRGGGFIRADPTPAGTSPTIDVKLHANLVKLLPRWAEYDSASAAAKAEWDRMIVKLGAHEQRHVDIAIEEANQVAADLPGKSVDDIVPTINAGNARMQKRQNDLDDANNTDHGAKPNVTYGDVSLDTSIV
jgi:Bacterial protein of unknown function (DUF922)